ncbi:Uncharacterised protein [Mycobacteroides abscessus subsp. abscessus]|nr:Uncharacterised protein [Mycobacteroides abscessus subsp. abscessus]
MLTGGAALDGDLEELGQLGRVGEDGERRLDLRDHRAGGGVADDVDGDVDLDLLAALDDDEVDVLDLTAHGLDLDVAGDREDVLRAVGALDLEQGVGVLEGHHRGVSLERDVDGVAAVAVDDRGDAAGAADAAGSALAEFVAGFCDELEVSHVSLLRGDLSCTTAKQSEAAPGAAYQGTRSGSGPRRSRRQASPSPRQPDYSTAPSVSAPSRSCTAAAHAASPSAVRRMS